MWSRLRAGRGPHPGGAQPDVQHSRSSGRGDDGVDQVDGGGTVGFTSVGPSRDEDCEPGDLEIYAIYLHPRAWGSGVARDLMRTVLDGLEPGIDVSLWILAENDRAQHFYRRHGFQHDGTERIDDIGGRPLTQLRFRRR